MSIAKGNFEVKQVEAPFKKSQEMPHYIFCPIQKNNPLHFQNQRYIGIFMSLREREREREREQERVSESKSKRDSKSKSESESKSKSKSESENKSESRREREKEKEREMRAIIFQNRPSRKEKSANYTVLERAV